MSPLAAALLLAFACTAMLALPLMPAWRERSRPTDCAPLHVSQDYAPQGDYFATRLRERLRERRGLPAGATYAGADMLAPEGSSFESLLGAGNVRLGAGSEVLHWAHADGRLEAEAGCTLLRRISAGGQVRLARDCCFERVGAPRIEFGEPPAAPTQIHAPAEQGAFDAIAGATLMGEGFHRVAGNVVLPPDTAFEGSLVVTGSLVVGERACIAGDVKARCGVIIGAGARMLGAVTCERGIHILRDAFVRGPVIAETDVLIARGVVIGTKEDPTTVTAENVMIESGVVAHGTVWAREVGVVWEAS